MKVGYLFPGQGAQSVGMGKELAENFKAADQVFDEANDLLGLDLKKIIFEGPDTQLTLTNHSQPAIFVTSIACLAVMKQEGLYVEPSACAGLSLGEFTALHIAGVFNFADTLKLVRQRGTFMQEACDQTEGAMASLIGANEKTARQICEQANQTALVDVANVNGPEQIVVSGTVQGVKKAIEIAEKQEVPKIVELNVEGAFHSRLMQSAREKLEEVLAEVQMQEPVFPVFCNVTGRKAESVDEIKQLLAKQVTSSVLWNQCMQGMFDLGVTNFIEVGCGRVLVGLLRRMKRDVSFSNIEDLRSLEKTKKFISSLVASR